MYLKKHKCIFLNENLEEHERYFVMAHELGHAIMHPKMNCYFIRNKTLLLTSRVEREANKFAVELLIGNDFLHENKDLTVDQLARLTGYCKDFIELRLEE
ncbi:MAG: ImmA/IrrE family metallo-endopeptidase [Lachnospiraceae bacterium]|nr:ImmA/IrrE family metallo-endopeptidase [Lachnospiraceae bacterium]